MDSFAISPSRSPPAPDVLLCCVDTRSPLVTLIGVLNSDVTTVSARNLSRWLFLLARQFARARPVRPPAVYRPITVVGADVFVRCLAEIGSEVFPCDSPDPLPPGCYALFDLEGNPYPYPVGRTAPRPSFAITQRGCDVPDDDPCTALRIAARKRDGGLCCFTGRPSNCITWIIPPLLSCAITPTFSLERCHDLDNVFTISSDLLQVYHENRIAVDPQDGYRIVVFEKFPDLVFLNHLHSLPSSGRFWHASLTWTLAVRLAGCDAGFDGVSTKAATELLDGLVHSDSRIILEDPVWSTTAGREALRTFFWMRTDSPFQSKDWEEPTLPASPSDFTLESALSLSPSTAGSFNGIDSVALAATQTSAPNGATIVSWVVFLGQRILLFYFYAQILFTLRSDM